MLKCTIPFNVLRHLQDICSSWSPMQNCRLTKWMRLEGSSAPCNWVSSGDHVLQPHLSRAGCPGPHPVRYLHWWRLHILSGQPVLVFDHPHKKKSVFLCSNGISCVLTCAQCLLHCQWALRRNVWLPLPYSPSAPRLPPQQVFIHMEIQWKH